MKKTSAATFATATLAAVLLAFAPGRAAADPPAIFVSDYNGGSNGYVSAYSGTGAAATGYTAPGGFSEADGVAYNPANNTLYVADATNNVVRTFNATTGAETQIGFANATGLNQPFGLTLNGGTLYVSNFNNSTITAYNAANGAPALGAFGVSGSSSYSSGAISGPTGMTVSGTTLYVANFGGFSVNAINLLTGMPMAGFTTITQTSAGVTTGFAPNDVAIYGNDLFMANRTGLTTAGSVLEFNATTGAVINNNFITGVNLAWGLKVLGNQLLVSASGGTTVGAYGIPALATTGNVPTSSNPNFLTGLSGPQYIAIVPEPGTWTLLAAGAVLLGLGVLRRRVA